MKLVNCTPHTLNLNCGQVLPASGTVARVSATFEKVAGQSCDNRSGCDDCGTVLEMGACTMACCAPTVYAQVFGEVTGLPEPVDGTMFVVSAMVLAALAGSRQDVVAPATGHPDCQRNDKGQVVSVPGFVR